MSFFFSLSLSLSLYIYIYIYIYIFIIFLRKRFFLGVLLLEEVVNSYDDEGICAIIDSTKQWFNESQIRKAAGNASWWRVNT